MNIGEGCDAIYVVNLIHTLGSLLQGSVNLGAPLLLRYSHLLAAVYADHDEAFSTCGWVDAALTNGLDEGLAGRVAPAGSEGRLNHGAELTFRHA